MNQLTFVATYDVAEFKAMYGVEKISIVKNPTTGKLFFDCNSSKGRISGAVSADYAENTKISLVKGDANEEFFLIHKGNSSENTIDTL